MNINSSLDFLNMIKNQTDDRRAPETKAESVKMPIESGETLTEYDMPVADDTPMIAVIDTETNWRDEVMSLGVAIADAQTYKCLGKRYYIFDPECRVGGMFSGVMYKGDVKPITCTRDEAMSDVGEFLMDRGITRIMAYNARFDLGHLPELMGFEWFDIMRIAAYRQHNHYIPESAPCCKTGRLKSNYGVESILRMITGDDRYYETHNAVIDACDELKIVELLGLSLDVYECARL
jgi:hypothetical protein